MVCHQALSSVLFQHYCCTGSHTPPVCLTVMDSHLHVVTSSNNEADEASGPSKKKPPHSSPSKLLQNLDMMFNQDISLCRPLTASPSIQPPRAPQPFPMAFNKEETISAAGGSQQQHSVSQSPSQTLSQQWPSQHHPSPPPLTKVQKGTGSSLKEGQIPHVQGGAAAGSSISISTGGSGIDDLDDDDNLVFPLLIVRARRALEQQRLAATGQDVDQDLM